MTDNGNTPHSYRVSFAIWDHIVLSAMCLTSENSLP